MAGRASIAKEAAITRLVGAILLEQNDEGAVRRSRYMTLETIAPIRFVHDVQITRESPNYLVG